MEELKKGTKLRIQVKNDLTRKYDIIEKGCTAAATLLKNKIQAGSVKIRNYKEKSLQRKQNTHLKTKQADLYKELNGTKNSANPSPDAEESLAFWRNIWEKEVHHENAEWMEGMQQGFAEDVKKQSNIKIKYEDVTKRIRGMSNWKAAGPDGVRGYWFKQLDCLHQPLVAALQTCLDLGETPDWLVEGRTVLIQKAPEKGTEASNYRQ